jgi:hypothetical protein
MVMLNDLVAIMAGALIINAVPWSLGQLLAGRKARGEGIGESLLVGAMAGNLVGVGFVWLVARLVPNYIGAPAYGPDVMVVLTIVVPGAWLGGISGIAATLCRRGHATAAGRLSLGLGALILFSVYAADGVILRETVRDLLASPSVAVPFLYGPLLLTAAGSWLLLRPRPHATP